MTINNDTLYSMAQIDLSVGPVMLHVPDTSGRYYVLQFVDAWTNNFAYVGHRATGTAESDFLLVPPAWDGDAPATSTIIRFPTRVASIVGRLACAGDDDLPNVHGLQDQTSLTPLEPNTTPAGLPTPETVVGEALLFYERLRVWSQAFPPPPRDASLQASLSPLRIGQDGTSPYTDPDTPLATTLTSGYDTGQATLAKALTSGSSPEVNGWKLTLHAFDYNLDYFEVGAVDDPQFKITDPKLRIVERAAAAKGGLWGNHPYEAAYIMTYLDDHGQLLSGENTYTLRLDPTPPVNAFWSLTMYSVPDFFLVENPINRYSIGDRTPGVIRDDDGALTITISHDRPTDPVAAANWLPAPDCPFRPVLRMYEPDPSVINMTYVVPAITRQSRI